MVSPMTSSGAPSVRTVSRSPVNTASTASVISSPSGRLRFCGWKPRPDQRPGAPPFEQLANVCLWLVRQHGADRALGQSRELVPALAHIRRDPGDLPGTGDL